MKGFRLINWLRNISIARKLYFTVGIMAMLIAVELMTLLFAIHTLSSVRTLVGAEGLWSKGQKDAAYNLQKYAYSHDEKDYQKFLYFLQVPDGDHITRTELSKPNPDIEVARAGFRQGRVHEDDIDGAIKLLTRFHSVDYLSKAIALWSKGDTMMSELHVLGEQMHAEVTSPARSQEKIMATLAGLDELNDKLTHLEDEFSYTLGEGSRWLANLILKLLFGIVLTVEICGLSLTIIVSRSISRGLNEIIHASEKIADGDFTVRARAFSKDEIGVLANAFNDMTAKLEQNISDLRQSEEALSNSRDVAEQAVVIKDHFLANMSHEIRTPMNAIIGFTDLLDNSKLDEDQRQFVQAIKISGQNLTTIINDILDYSRIKSGMITLESIDLDIRKVVGSVHTLLKQKAGERNLDFTMEVAPGIPQIVKGDPTRLTQIITNLTDNALKFTEKGSVRIEVLLKEDKGESLLLEFRISDTGIGVSPEKQSAIFERFIQESVETNRKYGGTGLGLSIVKTLVELMKGTTTVDSQVNKGSVFTVTIPFEKAPVAAPKATAGMTLPDAAHIPKLKILYAEDHPLNQILVLHFSSKYGFETEIAENGRLAVEKLQANHYDLVLMDMQMPEMDGYEATKIIRTEMGRDIPIIALTAHAMSGEKEKCLALGMNDFVTKPFDPQQLYDKIMGVGDWGQA
ncbi:MAG: response regulator [Sphingobacteriales bacterium]|nr:MAG: response regulator [Sphingobacteriales bacterium]